MTAAVAPDALSGGFADTPVQAARAFRAALNALARPGTHRALTGANPPAPLSVAAGTLLLTLADATTPVHLAASHDTAAVRDWLTFHCAAPLVAPGQAVFALGSWEALQPVSRFAIGTPDYPDRAATLIVEMAGAAPFNARLTGPGIRGSVPVALPDIAAFAANHARFPLGFDTFLAMGDRITGLPRSTHVEGI